MFQPFYWFLNFLSQLLRKRYQQAKSGLPLTSIRNRAEVLEVLQEWIQKGSGAEDLLDDGQLYDAFKAFNSELMREETFPGSQRDSTDVRISEAWKNLSQTKQSLISLFTTHTKRPPIKRPSTELHEITGDGYPRASSDPPDIDRSSPEELVSIIDAMMNAAFRNVTEEVSAADCNTSDWFIDMIIGYPRRIRPSRDPVYRSYWMVRYSRAGDQRRRGRSPDLLFVGLRSRNYVVGL